MKTPCSFDFASTLLWPNHDILTKVSEYCSGTSSHRLNSQQSLHNGEPHHDSWLCKLKSSGQKLRTLKIVFRESGELLTVPVQRSSHPIRTLYRHLAVSKH